MDRAEFHKDASLLELYAKTANAVDEMPKMLKDLSTKPLRFFLCVAYVDDEDGTGRLFSAIVGEPSLILNGVMASLNMGMEQAGE